MNEQLLRIGPNRLVGVVTAPGAASGAARPGVILLNSGLIQRVGPNRLYVRLARALAERGHPVMRFDLSAIGDSPRRLDSLPFERSAVEETGEAMAALRSGWGTERFVLAGICTGAVVAFRTARVDEAVSGVGMINPQGLTPRDNEGTEDYLGRRAASRYYLGQALVRPASWKKLATGRADLGAIARACGHRVRSLLGRPPGLDTPEAQSIAEDLVRLGRERQLLLMFSAGDPGYDELGLILGQRMREVRAAAGTTLRTIAGADHMFTPLHHQHAFLDQVADWTAGVGAPSSAPAEAAL